MHAGERDGSEVARGRERECFITLNGDGPVSLSSDPHPNFSGVGT